MTFASCQELYEPGNLESNKKIPVIQGRITNGAGNHTVTLQWASPFNKNKISSITNVRQVRISDNAGNHEILREASGGKYYSSPDGIKGIPGRKYKLHVELMSGEVYETDYIKMNKEIAIDTIYAETGKKEIVKRNNEGELLTLKKEGLYLFYNLKTQSSEKKFVRIATTVISQSKYVKGLNSPFPTPVYCWEKWKLEDMPAIGLTHSEGNDQVIEDEKLGFLPYEYHSFESTESTSAPVPKGWILNSTVRSVTPEAYAYYKAITEQLGAEERIFDPIPSQINGNIYCVSDSTKKVFGFFEVAPGTSFNKAFYWTPGTDSIKVRKVESFPEDIKSSCQENFTPGFWVDFFNK